MRNNFDINAKLQAENAISMMDMVDNLVAKGYMKPADARDAAVSLFEM